MRAGYALPVSFVLALLFMLAPWSTASLEWRPNFLLLCVLFWGIRAPQLCGVGIAWLMGLLTDLMGGDVFGQHALSYTLVMSVTLLYRQRLELIHSLKEAGFIWLLLLLEPFLFCSIKWMMEGQWSGNGYFFQSISGALLWFLLIHIGFGAHRSS